MRIRIGIEYLWLFFLHCYSCVTNSFVNSLSLLGIPRDPLTDCISPLDCLTRSVWEKCEVNNTGRQTETLLYIETARIIRLRHHRDIFDKKMLFARYALLLKSNLSFRLYPVCVSRYVYLEMEYLRLLRYVKICDYVTSIISESRYVHAELSLLLDRLHVSQLENYRWPSSRFLRPRSRRLPVIGGLKVGEMRLNHHTKAALITIWCLRQCFTLR